MVCRILVPRPGIEPLPPAKEVQSLNHWTAREVPENSLKQHVGGSSPPQGAPYAKYLTSRRNGRGVLRVVLVGENGLPLPENRGGSQAGAFIFVF